MLLQSNNLQNPPKNKKNRKTLWNLLSSFPRQQKQEFDFFGETRIILGDNRLILLSKLGKSSRGFVFSQRICNYIRY